MDGWISVLCLCQAQYCCVCHLHFDSTYHTIIVVMHVKQPCAACVNSCINYKRSICVLSDAREMDNWKAQLKYLRVDSLSCLNFFTRCVFLSFLLFVDGQTGKQLAKDTKSCTELQCWMFILSGFCSTSEPVHITGGHFIWYRYETCCYLEL